MATYIISGVSAASCAANGFTVISSTTGVTGAFGAINPSYKTDAMVGVDFVIAYDDSVDPTAAQAAFTSPAAGNPLYIAQRVPLGAANSYTVCFPQFSGQGAATTACRVMAYVFPSDGTNFTTNDYLSAAIQGYDPQVRSVAAFITTMKGIGIPVFNNSGVLQ
jgi:hypothetical protein